jgi:hypothetical protein
VEFWLDDGTRGELVAVDVTVVPPIPLLDSHRPRAGTTDASDRASFRVTLPGLHKPA